MAIEGLTSQEVVPKPLWNTPLPITKNAAQKHERQVYHANYDERLEVLPQNKASFTEKDVTLGTKAGQKTDDELSFWDFLDVINPLQHIPLIGSVYRYVTGDEIKGIARVAGGGLYGGPFGMAFGAVNAVIAQNEGDDLGGIILADTFGPSPHDTPSGKAEMSIQIADLDNNSNQTPIPTSRFAAEETVLPQETAKIDEKNSKKTEKEEKPNYIVAQNDTKPSENSEWQAYYTHQLSLQRKNLDDYQNSLADDTYERQLLQQAEKQAVAEQNKARMARESKNEERVHSIQRMKTFAAEEAQRREKATKEYVRTDKYGLRESAGMYPTTSP